MLWSSVVLLSDLSYSAFIVPISIGMWTTFCECVLCGVLPVPS